MNWIELLQYLLLAIVQGISEVLPISSSGHLALLQAILGTNAGNEAFFALLLHLGSLVAFLIFFSPIIIRLFQHLWLWIQGNRTDPVQDDMRLILYLVIATIPAALAGYLIKDAIDAIFQSLWLVAAGFFFTASLLFIIPRYAKLSHGAYSFKNTLASGFAQVLGILPGVSRSGMTLIGGLMGGLTLQKAKEFAFLLFIPITLGSALVSVNRLDRLTPTLLTYTMLATMVAGVVTYLTLRLVFRYLTLQHFRYFAYYLIGVGSITLILALLSL
jgi:undecaprenyl-diphosphatase